jgi:hypothetical protein
VQWVTDVPTEFTDMAELVAVKKRSDVERKGGRRLLGSVPPIARERLMPSVCPRRLMATPQAQPAR